MAINTTILNLISQRSLSMSPLLSGHKVFSLKSCSFSRQFSPIIYSSLPFKIHSSKFSNSLSGSVALASKTITTTTTIELVFQEESDSPVEITNCHFVNIKSNRPVIYIESTRPLFISKSSFTKCEVSQYPIIFTRTKKNVISSLCFIECVSTECGVKTDGGDNSIISLSTFAGCKSSDIVLQTDRCAVAQVNSSRSQSIDSKPKCCLLCEQFKLIKLDNNIYDMDNTPFAIIIKAASYHIINGLNLIKEKKTEVKSGLICVENYDLSVFNSVIINKVEPDASKALPAAKITFINCIFSSAPENAERILTASCTVRDNVTLIPMTVLNTYLCPASMIPIQVNNIPRFMDTKLREDQALIVIMGVGIVAGIFVSIIFYIKLSPYIAPRESSRSKKNFQRA